MPEHDEAGEERESSGARDEQSMERGGTGPRFPMTITDEEERHDRRELPADVEHDDLVGLDQEEHPAGEPEE